MADKKFVVRCKPGKFPDQVEIGLTMADIQTNVRINKGKESGKPYAEII